MSTSFYHSENDLSLKRKRAALEQLLRNKADTKKNLPLSSAQEQLWFLAQLEPDSPLYNIPTALVLDGPLDLLALEHSIQELGKRHEILRTCFVIREARPFQHIAAHLALPLPLIDLMTLPEAQRERLVPILTQQHALLPFDLSRLPLIRGMVLRLEAQRHVLLLTMHHSISDGWSMQVFFRELSTLYAAFRMNRPSPLEPLPLQYADYTLWQRQWLSSPAWEEHLAYWKKQLVALPQLSLPTDRPRPAVQQFQGRTFFFPCSPELTQALKRFSQQEGITLFMTLLAAFQLLLARYSGQEDFAIGTPVANRTRQELEPLIGFFVNTLVIRTDLSGNLTVRALLKRVRESTLQAFAHQEMPFEKLVEALNPQRSLGQQPLVQVLFGVQNAPNNLLELGEIKVQELPVAYEMAKFDLSLDMHEKREGLVGAIEYDRDLFESSTIERLAGHYQQVLQQMVADPDERLSALSLLTPPERRQLLEEWNATRSAYPHELCLHHLFEQQVARTPDAIALVFEEQRLTYGELNRRANQLAHSLQQRGVKPEEVVGLCVERGIAVVVGLLGILKAGAAYLPLDPTAPAERLAYMLQDAEVTFLVTQQPLQSQLSIQGTRFLCLDTDWEQIAQAPVHNPPDVVTGAHLAYVMYTSGSTGQPKGVLVTHRSVVNAYFAWSQAYDLSSRTTHLQMANVTFDVFLGDTIRALASGARLVLCPQELLLQPEKLYALLRQEQVEVAEFVPVVLRSLISYLEKTAQSLSFLRLVMVGSDSWYEQDLQRLQTLCSSQTMVVNSYGVTEATIDSAYFSGPLPVATGMVPIGRPFANTQLYLLDASLQPVPIGVAGELYIGGAGVARGYLKRQELTASRFIPHPFSRLPGSRLYKTGDLARFLFEGVIELIGRNDQQVKLRGVRIELEEIEAVLRQHPRVREAIVLVRADTTGEPRIVAYVVGQQPGELLDPGIFHQFLQKRLLKQMLPAAFVLLDAFPLTPNGKIARQHLPVPAWSVRPLLEESYEAAHTSTQQELVTIWQEVLGREQIGIHDNFFELGGHSLLAAQLMNHIRDAFVVDIPLRTLFESPTIAQMAPILEQVQMDLLSQTENEELTQMLADIKGLSKEALELLIADEMTK